MRDVPQTILDAIAGTNSDATLVCHAVYDGQVVAADLGISDWSFSWRLGDQQTIQGSGSFTVQDPDGRLAPWGYDEPLAVGGSRIQAVFACAGETVPMGEWVVTTNAPNESWRLTRAGLKWVHGGATIPVTAADLTQLLDDSRFMSPEAPQSGGTVFSEIRRMCEDIITVEFVGVVDKAIPANMVYESRINTVVDLSRMVGDFRVTADGILQVYDPSRPAAPAWTIMPGVDGDLISVDRQQSRSDLYNAVVTTGQTEDGKELRAYETLKSGPLRFDGPFGRKPLEQSSTGTTQQELYLDAREAMENQVVSATTTLEVNCTPSPLYEIGDWGAIAHPVIDGTTRSLIGRCIGVEFSGGSAGLQSMKLTMECPTADVLAIAQYVRRAGG